MGGELRIYLLMGVALMAGVIVGYLLMSNNWRRVFGAFFGAHVLAAIGLFLGARNAPGMEGMSYAIGLFVFVLPSMFGMAISGLVMYWRRR